MNNYKPLGRMKTILTEDLPDYDDDDFGGTRAQTKFTGTGYYIITRQIILWVIPQMLLRAI